ncbi:zf-CCHC domain-containing protein [Tanacetum coccineum]
MSTQQDINAIRAQRLANTHDPLALMANTQTPFHPYHSSLITYIQHPQPNNNFVPQPSFNTNYLQHPMQNPGDILNPTTVLDMALEFMQNAYQNQGIQNVRNQIGLSVVSEIANQYGNGNVVTARAEGNSNGINGNQIRCYNCKGDGHVACNCTVKPGKQGAAYLQKQMQIALKEEARIQLTQEEFDLMADAGAYEEIERVNVNCTLKDNLQQASSSGTQSHKAPVYDSDGSAEVHHSENCYDNNIFNMFTQEE